VKTMFFSEQEVIKLAKDAYQYGEAKFEIIPERCALLVIDMQDEFVKPNWTPFWVPEATRITPRIKTLIDSCRKKKIPVIYTAFFKTHNYLDRPKTGSFMPNRYTSVGVNNETWIGGENIWHELNPQLGDIIIYKPSYGAFYDTPLETILKNLEKDTIIVTGTMTNFCCGMTARQGYERGFKVIFGSDVTATDDFEMHENELKVLRKGFARVLKSDEIIFHLKL
jgi:nicotinamidase-related amidase